MQDVGAYGYKFDRTEIDLEIFIILRDWTLTNWTCKNVVFVKIKRHEYNYFFITNLMINILVLTTNVFTYIESGLGNVLIILNSS